MSLDLVCDPNMQGEFRQRMCCRQSLSRASTSSPAIGRPGQPLGLVARAAVASLRPRVFLGMVPAVSLAGSEGAKA